MQERWMSSPADIAIYGGAAGSGKSFALTLEAARHAHVKDYSAIIFRRTSPELTGGGSIWEESLGIYPALGGDPREHRLDWKFPSGASVQFSHLQYRKDVLSHQSKQYAFVGFDQLEQFDAEQFWFMLSRNRSTCGVRPLVRAAANPDPDCFLYENGAGLIAWWIGEDGYPIAERSGVVRWFVRTGDSLRWADDPTELDPDPSIPKSVTFVPAKLDDNPSLVRLDPGYRSRLLALPRVQRERLLHGNWKVRPTAGMYFRRSEFEIVDELPCEPVRTVRAWDKASTEPNESNKDPDWTAGVKIARLSDGRFAVLHVERMRARTGKVDRAMRRTAEQDGQSCAVAVFQDPGQAGKVDVEHMRSVLAGFAIRVLRASSSKETFCGPFSSQVEGGRVVLLRGSWNEAFLDELENFPSAKHDDQVDASSLAFHFVSHNELAIA